MQLKRSLLYCEYTLTVGIMALGDMKSPKEE
jgi:hypothetical protein